MASFFVYSFPFQYQTHFNVVNKMIDDIKERVKSHGEKVPELTSAMRLMVEKCTNIGGNIDDKMQSIYEQMRQIVHQVQLNADEIKKSVEPALLAAEMNVQQTVDAITDTLNAHQIAINDEPFIFTQPKLPDEFKATQSQLKNTIMEKAVLVNNLLENVTNKNSSTIKYGIQHLDTISMNIPAKRDTIKHSGEVASLRNDLNENKLLATQHYEDSAFIVSEIAMTTQHEATTLNQQITSCQKQLKYFREMDFCEYQPSGMDYKHFLSTHFDCGPFFTWLILIACIYFSSMIFFYFTGETPAKRDYNPNVSLAATTPLDKIKQRFRDRLSQISNCSPSNADYSFLDK